MSRPPRQPRRQEVDPGALAAFDAVIERAAELARAGVIAAQQIGPSAPEAGRSRHVEEDAGYYGRLLLAPEIAYHLVELGRVRLAGDRPDRYTHLEREMVDQVLSADLHINVVQPQHIPGAVAAGMRLDAIDALQRGREESLIEEEQELIHFIRTVIHGEMTDEYWAETEALKGERWIVVYSIFILFLQMTIRLQQLVGMPDPANAQMRQLVGDLRDGTRPLPSPQ